jgi:hypothetical protein
MSVESVTNQSHAEDDIPAWIPRVLNAAAIYNLAWGLFTLFFPLLLFRWAGMASPNYPSILQALGMVIAVYGIGFAIAARDPVNQWPLVLVGLLGKIFGPIGFVYAVAIGELPWWWWGNILTNDLIWWIPFTAIILHAIRIQDARRTPTGPNLADALKLAKTQSGESMYELSQRQELLVVCVRHSGCTYCREALDDLSRQKSVIKAAGVRPVIVHMGTFDQGQQMLRQYGCEEFDQVSDPTRHVYQALELRLGTLSELFGPRAFWRALVEGTVFRFGFGRIVGSALQMPGAFLIRDGRIVKAYRHAFSGDRPNYVELACPLNSSIAPH